jgi:hypothetical protein
MRFTLPRHSLGNASEIGPRRSNDGSRALPHHARARPSQWPCPNEEEIARLRHMDEAASTPHRRPPLRHSRRGVITRQDKTMQKVELRDEASSNLEMECIGLGWGRFRGASTGLGSDGTAGQTAAGRKGAREKGGSGQAREGGWGDSGVLIEERFRG